MTATVQRRAVLSCDVRGCSAADAEPWTSGGPLALAGWSQIRTSGGNVVDLCPDCADMLARVVLAGDFERGLPSPAIALSPSGEVQ